MNGWLLDTTALSELRKPKPEPKVVAFVKAKPLDLLHVSAATFAEIRFGIELVADAGKRAELTEWLANKMRPMFEGRVMPISEDIMLKWRLMSKKAARPATPSRNPISSSPRPPSTMD